MAGLDPATHAAPFSGRCQLNANVTAWMAGSSPAMTEERPAMTEERPVMTKGGILTP